jgi:Na+-driven multidrug efflux pump
MRKLHLIVGVLTLIAFIITGQYLSRAYPGMAGVDDGLRMLLRSRHLYIMLAGAVNVALGLYLSGRARGWRAAVRRLGSALLLVAPVLLIVAFFTEAPRGRMDAPLAPFGLYAVFGGTVLHLIGGARAGRETADPAARGKAAGAAE